jgi:hypothetical protein
MCVYSVYACVALQRGAQVACVTSGVPRHTGLESNRIFIGSSAGDTATMPTSRA